KDTLNQLPPTQRSNFSTSNNLSYSYANPYPKDDTVSNTGYKLNGNVPADMAIAADRNDAPSPKSGLKSNSPATDQKTMNSTNHEQEGQNVLHNDGHVEWVTTAWAGANQDNIYAAAGTKTLSGGGGVSQNNPADTATGLEPKLDLDTVLVPKKGNG